MIDTPLSGQKTGLAHLCLEKLFNILPTVELAPGTHGSPDKLSIGQLEDEDFYNLVKSLRGVKMSK